MVPAPVLLTGMETISMAKSGISVAIYLSGLFHVNANDKYAIK